MSTQAAVEPTEHIAAAEQAVSVVIPTRDRADLLALTLRSVLRQDGVALEVTVVDDGSQDDSAERVVHALGDPRLRYLRNDRSAGVSAARNRGIELSSAAWLAFCDHDDLWGPQKLVRQVAAADREGALWALSGSVRINGKGQLIGADPAPVGAQVPDVVRRRNPVPGGCSNVIVRRAALDRVGWFDPRFFMHEDWDLWIRLSLAGPPATVDRPDVAYRIHGGSMSLDVAGLNAERRLLEALHGTEVDRGAYAHYLAWLCMRAGRHPAAVWQFTRAALSGQATGVARDAALIAGERSSLFRRRNLFARALQAQHPAGQEAWTTQAESWLRSLDVPA